MLNIAQYQRHRQVRQRSDGIGRIVLQTVAQQLEIFTVNEFHGVVCSIASNFIVIDQIVAVVCDF